jgi:hypothetical protein
VTPSAQAHRDHASRAKRVWFFVTPGAELLDLAGLAGRVDLGGTPLTPWLAGAIVTTSARGDRSPHEQ